MLIAQGQSPDSQHMVKRLYFNFRANARQYEGARIVPYVHSSAIRRIEYNPTTKVLSIWFVESGGPYDYYGVPYHVYEAFLAAPSKGTFFNMYIRDQYAA